MGCLRVSSRSVWSSQRFFLGRSAHPPVGFSHAAFHTAVTPSCCLLSVLFVVSSGSLSSLCGFALGSPFVSFLHFCIEIKHLKRYL